jgi:hypothetical protein
MKIFYPGAQHLSTITQLLWCFTSYELLVVGSYTYLKDATFYSSRNDDSSSIQRKRMKNFGNMTEDEVMNLLLPDRLGKAMDILFVSCKYLSSFQPLKTK